MNSLLFCVVVKIRLWKGVRKE